MGWLPVQLRVFFNCLLRFGRRQTQTQTRTHIAYSPTPSTHSEFHWTIPHMPSHAFAIPGDRISHSNKQTTN